jgi:hypothetical protein
LFSGVGSQNAQNVWNADKIQRCRVIPDRHTHFTRGIMKKLLVPFAVSALLLAGCSTETNSPEAPSVEAVAPSTSEAAAAPTTEAAEASAPRPSAEPTTDAPEPTPPATPAPTPSADPTPVIDPYELYPPTEVAFIQAIEDGRSEATSDSTELQRSVAQTERDAALCAVSNNGVIDGWRGEVVEIGANGDGLAHVKIEIADGVILQTWNNAFSDALDGTLIPPGTPAFDNLVQMEEGAQVTFYGQTVGSDTACVKGSNITDTFYMIDPNFIVRITDIQAL